MVVYKNSRLPFGTRRGGGVDAQLLTARGTNPVLEVGMDKRSYYKWMNDFLTGVLVLTIAGNIVEP